MFEHSDFEKAQNGMTERWKFAWLSGVTTLVYVNSLFNGFTYDDEANILANQAVKTFSVRGFFRPFQLMNLFRPVTYASYGLNWKLSSANALGFHLGNLLLHVAVTLLLYFVLREVLDQVAWAQTVSFVASLLFAVHPIHTEAVTSIVGRAELLAAGFLLGAWLLHLKDRQIFALLCFALAVLSKESAVAFLPLVLAGDYVRGKFKPVVCYVGIAAVTAMYLVLLWRVQGGRFGPPLVAFLDNPLYSLPTRLRVLNAVRIAWKYVGLQLFPARLSCDYSYDGIVLYATWRHFVLPVLGAVIALVLWLWAGLRERRGWFLAGAVYLAGSAVTSNVMVASGTIMGERLTYLPSAGFCLMGALLWVELETRQARLARVLLVLLLAVLGGRTVMRNSDWHDNLRLFSAGVDVVPRSARLHANLGNEYMKQGQMEAASKEFEIALNIYPDHFGALAESGLIESWKGNQQSAERLLLKALSLTGENDPSYPFEVVSLASVWNREGKYAEARKLLDAVIERWPTYAPAWTERAIIHHARGELSAARTDAESALRLDPNSGQAQRVLKLLPEEVPRRAP